MIGNKTNWVPEYSQCTPNLGILSQGRQHIGWRDESLLKQDGVHQHQVKRGGGCWEIPISYVLLVMGSDSNATLFMPETLMFPFHFNIQIYYLHCNG